METSSASTEEQQRELLSERIYDRLHPFMAWLAVVFLLVVLGDNMVRAESPFATILTVAGWVIWAAFAVEFSLRMLIAPSKRRFFKRHGWQSVFLVFPFLGFLRFAMALRVARAGRVLSAGIRGTRTAGHVFTSRLAWLGAVTVIVILLGADLAYELGGIRPYGTALYEVSLAALGGAPLAARSAVAQVLDVFLVLYSVVVFAALAGTIGAYFLGDRHQPPNPQE